MHVELVVPGLFGADAPVPTPSIDLLLARARRKAGAARTLEEWLRDAFHLEGGLPAGALTLIAAGGDAADHFWLRADPVHLHLLRDRVVIVAAEEFGIRAEEAEALCASLNRHFDGAMELRRFDSRRWVAKLPKEQPQLDEQPAIALTGRAIGVGGKSERELTEIQMVLHSHPVNDEREARGEPVVNSLWLWGAGRAPAPPPADWQSVTADDPVALGLARLAGARHRSVPASADAWLERSPEDGRHLVVLDRLRLPSAIADRAGCCFEVQGLERDWFTPLLAALRNGRIGMLTVHVLHGSGVESFETIRGDLRRFWRRPKALALYNTALERNRAPERTP